MMIIFHFIFKILKNPILKVELSKILKLFLLAQNGLHVNEILIF
jgi:hypothetical protein